MSISSHVSIHRRAVRQPARKWHQRVPIRSCVLWLAVALTLAAVMLGAVVALEVVTAHRPLTPPSRGEHTEDFVSHIDSIGAER
jgi:hypothetical protein